MRAKFVFIFFIIFAIAAVLIILQFFPILKTTSGALSVLTNPISARLYNMTNWAARAGSFLSSAPSKAEESEKLRQEIRSLSSQVVNLQGLAAENEILKKQLNFLDEAKYPYVMARVIGRLNDESQAIIILDKGAKDGVKVDLPAVVDNGVIVGKIFKVEEKKSFLLLSTANHSRLAAAFSKIAAAGTSGLVRGEHNLGLYMELIPKDTQISNDDIIITSGLESLVPRGLVIGKIEQINSNASDLFQSAYLQSLYSPSDLQIVTIIFSHEN